MNPSSGLRQGDPLSHIYLICAEGLSSLLYETHNKGFISGITINNNWPSSSYHFFADDSLVFFKANGRECGWVKKALIDYEMASIQKINFSKVVRCVSPNVSSNCSQYLQQILGVQLVRNLDNYLGLPSYFSRRKWEDFNFLRSVSGR